eukprot:7378349-Prymnesium_polylepis.2
MLYDEASVSRYFSALNHALPSRGERIDVLLEFDDRSSQSLTDDDATASADWLKEQTLWLRAALNATRFISSPRLGDSSIIWRDGAPAATRTQLLAAGYNPQEMLSLRSTLSCLNGHIYAKSGQSITAFAYAARDVYLEQDALMVLYTAHSVGLVLAAVVATVFALTLLPGFAWVMALCMVSSCVHMLGAP